MMRSTLLVAVLVVISAAAFPFSKSSGVTELTPATLNGFLNTHKPVYIMFYAPWCGHCKKMHPDYEKFAKGVKDVVRVGAVNADQHRELGSQFGVQGFPTIKYWKMGNKKGTKPLDYEGQRTAGGLHSAALSQITHNVVTITTQDDITKQMEKSTSGKGVILFSSKNKSPPMFSVMSQSPHFKGKITFLLAMEKTKTLTEALGVEKIPSIIVVSPPKEGGGELEKEIYSGPMEYMSIAKFLQASLGEESGNAKATSGDAETAAEAEEGQDEQEPKKKEMRGTSKKGARPAHPVTPVELTAMSFNTFCAPGAPKVNGQQPFCVLALGEKFSLHDLHAKFQNEAVLFFTAKDEHALEYVEHFQTNLQPVSILEKNDLIFLRAGKDRTKYLVYKEVEGHEIVEDSIDNLLQRVLGGETTFEKHPGFPKL